MTANHSIDPAQFLSQHLERAESDLLRAMLKTFIDALLTSCARTGHPDHHQALESLGLHETVRRSRSRLPI